MHTRRPLLLLASLLCGTALLAQSSNVARGRVFWMGFMENYEPESSIMKVYIACDVATTGVASMPLNGWVQPFTVPANGVAVVDVPLSAMHTTSDVVENKGLLITTLDSSSVYALNFDVATADASSILPFQSLGTEYRVQAYRGLDGFDGLNSEFMIIGAVDSTEVEVTTSCNTYGGHTAGVPFTVSLQAGQSYHVLASDVVGDLTGTTVHSTDTDGGCHPFAVFGGSRCPDVPAGCFACDHLFEEMVPLAAWGTRYFSTPFTDQTSYTLRVLANRDNTQVVIDGTPITLLAAGQVQEINNMVGTHCITGDQPFSVAQLMQGHDCTGQNSDPSMLILNKDEERATDVTFTTIVSPNMTEHWVNVITRPGSLSTIALDGLPVDTALFASFTSCEDHVWGTIPLTEGSHRLTAAVGFSAYVYGHGPNYESYAYGLGTVSTEVSDTLFCYTGGAVTLTAPSYITDPYWYNINTPQDTLATGNTYTFTPGQAVSIGVSQVGTGNCIEGRRYHIGFTTPVTATLGVDPTIVCAGDSVTLSVDVDPDTLNVVSVWTPLFLLDDPLSRNPTAIVPMSMWFTVHVTGDYGCSSMSDSVFVSTLPPPAPTILQNGNTLTVDAVYSAYQWFLNGSTVPGANAQSYEVTFNGEYSVVVTDANGCSGTTSMYVLFDAITELDPAPVSITAGPGYAQVRTMHGAERIELFDLLGQRVAQSLDHGTEVRLPVLSTGVYVARVQVEGVSITRRVPVLR